MRTLDALVGLVPIISTELGMRPVFNKRLDHL